MAEITRVNMAAEQSTETTIGATGSRLGWLGVAAAAFVGIGLLSSSSWLFSDLVGEWPGVNFWIVLLSAFVPALLVALSISALGAIARSPAPDYFITSRTLNPLLGFISSWFFVLSTALFTGGLVGKLVGKSLAEFLSIFGLVLDIPDVLPLVESASSAPVIAMLGTVVVVLAFILTVLSPQTFKRIINVAGGFIVIAGIILVLIFALAPANAFSNNLSLLFGSGAYSERIDIAYQYGMSSSSPPAIVNWVYGLLLGLFVFWGAGLPSYLATSIKNPHRNLLPGILGGALIAGGFLAALLFFLQKAVPAQFLSAESYLYQNGLEAPGLVLPSLPFYAAVLEPSPVLIGIVGLAWFMGVLVFVQLMLAVISQILVGWAKDGIIPDRLGYVQPKRQTAVIGMLIVASAMLVGVVDAAQGGLLISGMHLAIFLSISLLLPIISLVVFPFTKRDWFNQLRGWVGFKLLGIPLVSVIGFLSLVYLVWIIAAPYIYPYTIQLLNTNTYILAVVFILTGLAWYFLKKFLVRSKGKLN